jgi:hypothetical protein
VKPSAIFEVQRFNYQEAKFYRQKVLEKLMGEEEEDDDSPLRCLIGRQEERGVPNVKVKSANYKEESALQFLTSQNIPYSRVQVKRGPGRPPKRREVVAPA